MQPFFSCLELRNLPERTTETDAFQVIGFREADGVVGWMPRAMENLCRAAPRLLHSLTDRLVELLGLHVRGA